MELQDVKWNQFVDFQPGPDLTQYAEAVVNGNFTATTATGTKA
jgi:hypothetical protein